MAEQVVKDGISVGLSATPVGNCVANDENKSFSLPAGQTGEDDGVEAVLDTEMTLFS